jgi:hypothetical protein
MYNSIKLIIYSDDRLIFILEGEIALQRRFYGSLARLTTTNTLGEDLILDVRPNKKRKESATVVTQQGAVTLEVNRISSLRVKEMLFEMGLRRDFLNLQSIMKRSLFLKRNVTK